MKQYPCLLVLSMVCILAGCAVSPPPPPPEPDEMTVTKKMAEAEQLEKAGNPQKAFTLYSELQGQVEDVKLYREVQLRKANALFLMHSYPAALAALAPLPELPATLYDCRKLMLAACILQQLHGKPEHVEALLEVALDNSINEPGVIPVKAAGYAELGRIYVAHGKTSRAVKCFEYAAQLYKMDGNSKEAAICRNIGEYLR